MKREQEYQQNQRAGLLAIAADLLTVSLIFFTKAFYQPFFAGLGHLLLFPLSALTSLLRAMIAWRSLYLVGLQWVEFLNALVETVATFAVSFAVVGGFVSEAVFAVASPWIFTLMLAFKTSVFLLNTLYYGLRLLQSGEEAYYQAFLDNLLATFTTGLSTLACAFFFIGQQFAFALVGLFTCLWTATDLLYRAYHMEAPELKTVQSSSSLMSLAFSEELDLSAEPEPTSFIQKIDDKIQNDFRDEWIFDAEAVAVAAFGMRR